MCVGGGGVWRGGGREGERVEREVGREEEEGRGEGGSCRHVKYPFKHTQQWDVLTV